MPLYSSFSASICRFSLALPRGPSASRLGRPEDLEDRGRPRPVEREVARRFEMTPGDPGAPFLPGFLAPGPHPSYSHIQTKLWSFHGDRTTRACVRATRRVIKTSLGHPELGDA